MNFYDFPRKPEAGDYLLKFEHDEEGGIITDLLQIAEDVHEQFGYRWVNPRTLRISSQLFFRPHSHFRMFTLLGKIADKEIIFAAKMEFLLK